jgi:hypothetical protein
MDYIIESDFRIFVVSQFIHRKEFLNSGKKKTTKTEIVPAHALVKCAPCDLHSSLVLIFIHLRHKLPVTYPMTLQTLRHSRTKCSQIPFSSFGVQTRWKKTITVPSKLFHSCVLLKDLSKVCLRFQTPRSVPHTFPRLLKDTVLPAPLLAYLTTKFRVRTALCVSVIQLDKPQTQLQTG